MEETIIFYLFWNLTPSAPLCVTSCPLSILFTVYSFNHNSVSFVPNFWITFILTPNFSLYPEKRSSRLTRSGCCSACWTAHPGFSEGTKVYIRVLLHRHSQQYRKNIALSRVFFSAVSLFYYFYVLYSGFTAAFRHVYENESTNLAILSPVRVWEPSREMENTFAKSIAGKKRVLYSYRKGIERKESLLLQEM